MNGRHTSGTSTPALGHTATARPLVLLHSPTLTRISINVPSSAQEWIAAEVARDTFHDFLHYQEQQGHLVGFDAVEADEDNPDAASDDQREKQLVLAAYFLQHTASLLSFPESSTAPATAQVLLASYSYFVNSFLAPSSTDIHSLAAGIPAPLRALVISAYFAARTKLHNAGLSTKIPKAEGEESALLKGASKGDVELYALFGGQGMNEVYFDELQVGLGRARRTSFRRACPSCDDQRLTFRFLAPTNRPSSTSTRPSSFPSSPSPPRT